jgi:hypothetical protein
MDYKGSLLTLRNGTTLQFPYNDGSSLPLMLTTTHFRTSNKFAGLTFQDALTIGDSNELNTFMNLVDDNNQNIMSAQKELLLWHQRLGHADRQNVQRMLCQPGGNKFQQVLTPKNWNASTCSRPLCAACQLAKQRCQGSGSCTSIPVPEKLHRLSKDQLSPGQKVLIDQYMSVTHGPLGHTKGKEAKFKKFISGTLFFDHATQYIHCTHQVLLRVGETLKAKNLFEGWAKESGHTINHYHADNAPFWVDKFVLHYTNKGQALSYSGVGAHHQNGVAERTIQRVAT